ncbi:MAG TPA: hypothetical protein VFV87_03515 [Pirellulaceae bacterium]|nr:hypothetical protein [Pirellulaceae bacterium]
MRPFLLLCQWRWLAVVVGGLLLLRQIDDRIAHAELESWQDRLAVPAFEKRAWIDEQADHDFMRQWINVVISEASGPQSLRNVATPVHAE